MNNLFMDMLNTSGFQLIPGFWALFLLLYGLFQPARPERVKAKQGLHLGIQAKRLK